MVKFEPRFVAGIANNLNTHVALLLTTNFSVARADAWAVASQWAASVILRSIRQSRTVSIPHYQRFSEGLHVIMNGTTSGACIGKSFFPAEKNCRRLVKKDE